MAAPQPESSYFNQVYDDNRWWISRYQYLRGRYCLMIYVGIDVAKLNHFASAISSDGEVLFEPFKFTNDADGFQLLSSHSILFRMIASSSILSRRPTTVTNLSVTLLMMVIRSVSLTRSRLRPCGRTTSGRPRRIRLTLTSLLDLLLCSSLTGSSRLMVSTLWTSRLLAASARNRSNSVLG